MATESRFESEERLHRAIAAHPEVLPADDFGLGELVTLAVELDFGSGPMDLLAVDATGRLVIVEFKRGSENPDVRKVVAQVLDYGSALWRSSYDNLERGCERLNPAISSPLTTYVEAQLMSRGASTFDPDAFRQGVESCLDTGGFVFLYVGRDLDDRTERIMTYLAEGPRMSFFAVEVDYFITGEDETRVLVPRTAFVPSWVKQPAAPRSGLPAPADLRASAPPETLQLWDLMDDLALQMGLQVLIRSNGYAYVTPGLSFGIGIYRSGRGAEIDLQSLRARGAGEWADQFMTQLSEFVGTRVTAASYPAIPPALLTTRWTQARDTLIVPYFKQQRIVADRL